MDMEKGETRRGSIASKKKIAGRLEYLYRRKAKQNPSRQN